MTSPANDNLTKDYPADFLAGWDGCAHKDCLPACWVGLEGGYCERMERAFREYGGAVLTPDTPSRIP